ncbi:TGF-beta receptor type-1-like [Xenia sp. Carnegie-2017]|uniref:TGF-beta receptor type-1-like n=1 Tax=Xenia sp. Carnegie-2017 TaxID=2897299 RepID=UPI001F034981|nr:TGF-beta receptor type-1-like [Xenia sp. Carnegie-2017]
MKIHDGLLLIVAIVILSSLASNEARRLSKRVTCHSTLNTADATCETEFACFTYVMSIRKKQYHGCIDSDLYRLFMCNVTPTSTFVSKCCHEDMCNKNLTLSLPTSDSSPRDDIDNKEKVIYVGYGRTVIIALCISAPVCLITLTIMLYIYLRDRRLSILHKSLIESDPEFVVGKLPESSRLMDANIPQSLKDVARLEQTYSGSGSGLPLLIQRTIARQVILHDCIGKGRYGEVYRGTWRGEDVAVKIFSTRDECSWRRETEMYQTVMLRHEHILGFIAADNKDNGTWTQLWLVTDFHKKGSLCDYLTSVPELSIDGMLDMVISIASGLTHLHMEVHGTRGKPAIAHRDLKSRNILVKNNGTCCIADLGLAVCYDACNDSFDLPSGSRVGTKRYMAPELLDNTEPKTFHEYKKIDIYAMGLVLWEIARRCAFAGHPSEDYQLPYFEKVQADPSIEEMKETVCVEKFRPTISKTWDTNEIMKSMGKIIQECWYESSAARLPALRVKKSLIALKRNDPVDV